MNLLLRENRATVETFLQFLGVPASVARVNGPGDFSLIAINDAGREFFGLAPVTDETPIDVEHLAPLLLRGEGSAEAYLERLRTNYQRTVEAGVPVTTETEYMDGNGHVRWSQNSLVPVFDGESITRILVTYNEITELMEARDALERSLSGILAASNINVCEACHKVSDRPGHWETLSIFLQHRTSLGFTHQLCPRCESKYFGDVDGPP